MEDSIGRAKARIVQSPERIKKTIHIMSTTATDDKKTVVMHEAKARDLQAKINALHNIETVRGLGIKMVFNKTVVLGCSWMHRADSNH